MDQATVTISYRELAKRDDKLQQQINKVLASRGTVPLRSVQVDVHEGLAILRGAVCRYYDKQMAQEVVKAIDGVEKVKNEIDVL